ncbi:MAG: hypothetical protein ABIF77_09860 [bacterium]
MSDTQSIFLVLVLIYVWECFVLAPRQSGIFASTPGGGYRLTHTGNTFTLRGRGLHFINPLPPLGQVFLCRLWPISITPAAVYGYTSHTFNPGPRLHDDGDCYQFSEIKKVHSIGPDLLINGVVLARMASTAEARHLTRFLINLRESDPLQRRKSMTSFIRDNLETPAIRSRFELFRKETAGLAWFCNFLFLFLFGLCPFAVFRFGLSEVWQELLILLVGLLLLIGWEFWRNHAIFYPHARGDRLQRLVTMILCPPAAIRARHFISYQLFAGNPPLAVARVICGRAQYREFARAYWRDLKFPYRPACPVEEPLKQAVEQEYRQDYLAAVTSRLDADPDWSGNYRDDPRPDSPSCAAFCPRCLTQYTTTSGSCIDCGGIPLVSFPEPES